MEEKQISPEVREWEQLMEQQLPSKKPCRTCTVKTVQPQKVQTDDSIAYSDYIVIGLLVFLGVRLLAVLSRPPQRPQRINQSSYGEWYKEPKKICRPCDHYNQLSEKI